jgi:hypothetical protein
VYIVSLPVYVFVLNFQFPAILSAVGGALGLYTGFCGITCFEILELIMLTVLAILGWYGTSRRHQEVANGSQ